jgi:hypothetical protein
MEYWSTGLLESGEVVNKDFLVFRGGKPHTSRAQITHQGNASGRLEPEYFGFSCFWIYR